MDIPDEDPRVPVYAMAGIYLFGGFSENAGMADPPADPPLPGPPPAGEAAIEPV